MHTLTPRHLIFALLFAVPAALRAGEAGTAGADFLRIPVGARETALGGAFSAASSDANSVFYNPAGLGAALPEISYSYNNYLPGVSQHWLAGAASSAGGAFGFAVNYLNVDSFASYDAADNRTGSVSAYGLAGYFGYGRALRTGLRQLPVVRFGAAVKYISETLASSRASGYGLDAGVQLLTVLRGLSLGLAAENLAASRLEFINSGARPARTLKAGAAYAVGSGADDVSALVALDAAFPADGGSYLSAGVETLLYRTVALRAGYAASGDISNGLSFGLGLALPGKRRNTRLDYSFGSSYDLGSVHRFGVTRRFGGSTAAALGAKGEGSSAPALQSALKEEESEVVKSAIIEALGKLPPPVSE